GVVLRLAGVRECGTVRSGVDMARDVVYGRLLQAGGGLREGDREIERSLFEAMDLWLDGRLAADRRTVFERRMQIDPPLRERVEFHRGLTLELHEEAPALPRAFMPGLRDRLEKTRETLLLVDRAAGSAGLEALSGAPAHEPVVPSSRRPLPPWVIVAGALLLIVVGIALGVWLSRRGPPAT